jgi:hypothetical protein
MPDDTKKAIAHFGRAMHYFGAGSVGGASPAAEAEKKGPVLGFIVRFKDALKYTPVYFYNEVRFLESDKDAADGSRSLPRLWRADQPYVNELTRFYRTQRPERDYCYLSEDVDGRIDQTLFITEKVEDSFGFLIRSKKMGLMVLLTGFDSTRLDLFHFLADPETTSFKLHKLESIESIEFRKDAIVGRSPPVFLITALIVYSDQRALEQLKKIEQQIRASKTPFTDAISILHENKPQHEANAINSSQGHIETFKLTCETKREMPILLCWLYTVFLSGHITSDELDGFETDIRALQLSGMAKTDLSVRYLMMVLGKALREEIVKVECVAKREFKHTDLRLPSTAQY